MSSRNKKILAVASGGGHWVQLMRIRGAFTKCDVSYMTTNSDYVKEVEGNFFVITDANIWDKVRLVKMFLEVAWVIIRLRPDVVISTGAAPGFAALLFGRLIGAKTIWVDSIANSETLSYSGKKARRLADVWLTQWPHLVSDQGPQFWGSVI
jgi:UDP-N-acetylglucosamine:LPS N-acetylglucosamine transferase